MNKKKILSALLTISILTGALSGCGKGSDKAKEVHIGYFNNVTHAQALLMKADGSLEKSLGEDVSVTWTAFNAGPAEVEALFAGDIDIGYIGPVPAISANVKSKGDVSVLAGATKAGSVLVKRKGSDIESVADLAGKNVAIPQIGNTQHLILLALLSENGLKPVSEGGDVNVTAVANADVANVMERGDIDAALVPEPWGATLLAEDAELVLDEKQVFADGAYDVAVVVVRNEFMEENKDIVDTFMKGHENATMVISEGGEALDTINKELDEATGKSLSKEVIEEAFSRIQVSNDYDEASLNKFAEISKEQDFIQELPDDSLLVKR